MATTKIRSRERGPSVRAVAEALEAIAPSALAADWDNVGLIAGDLEARAQAVMLAIDLMPAVVDEAIAQGIDMVVAYHPPIFRPTARLVVPDDRMEAGIFRCIRAGIAVYTPHTALDAAAGGTNDVLARLCGMIDPRPLEPSEGDPTVGQGRFGALRPIALGALAKKVQRATKARCVSLVGDPAAIMERAIVLVGAAGSLPFALEPGPGDVIVTGEIRHHDALRILRVGASAIALSHWSSERPALEGLATLLAERLPGLRVTLSEADREPFTRL
jgi:dinuclear metal center YbgI/SA1388 family protein